MRVEKIAIASHEQILYVNVFEVIYCRSEKDGIEIRFTDGSVTRIHKQLSKLQSILPPFFVRVTQCVVINKLYITCIDKKEKQICLQGGFVITYTMSLGKLLERIGKIASPDNKIRPVSDQTAAFQENV